MWDNLTLKQKAEVMKLAVQQGISDLDSIRDLYNTSVNTFSVGGPKNNKKKYSSYSPSTSIKKRVTQWEGASMHSPAPDTGKVNRSFDDEAKDFNAVNRSLPGFDALPQASKDALFSYSYNVGVGNYKDRVHPVLKKFLMGQATVEDVQNAMWASKDSDPRMSGLRRRRAVERNLFAEGLGQDGVAYTSDDIPEEITWENYKKRQAAQNMQILNDRMNAINKSFTSATNTPTMIIPDLSSKPEIKDEDYLIKDTPRKNKGIGILPAIKLITQGPGALLSSLTPASSSNSLLGFLPSIKFDKGGSKINQQDLDRNNWRWATRDELQEDDPLINTLGDNDKWIVNSEGRLVPTSKVNEWLNSYERQLPYQEQNDIETAREVEKKAADRYVDSVGFSPVGKEIKDTAEMLIRYPVQYFVSSFRPSSTYIDLSNEKVATIDPNTKNVSSILFNDFLENSNDSARPARNFYNTQDTLIGDGKVPLSAISTFWGVEDNKLKVGPLENFDRNTTIVPNRAKGGDQLLSKVIFNPDFHKYAASNKKNSKKVRQEVERRGKELGVRPSIMPMILNPFKHGIQQIPSMYDIKHTLGEDKYCELVDEAQKMYPIRFSQTDDYPYLGITVNNDTIPIQVGHPKTFFGNPEGKSIFISNLTNNLNKVNAFLADNPSYIGLPDNGRFSGYQTNHPSFTSYRGIGTLPMYAIGTLSK